MKKVCNILSTIVISILVLILGINLIIIVKSKVKPNDVPGIFGYKPLIVLSGSMKSTIDIGDLVFVKDINIKDLKEGDIIAYKASSKSIVTHRIINVINDKNDICFETKGDSNNIKDDILVCNEKIVGKYIFKISKIGNAIMFIQKPMGLVLIMVVILSASAVIYLIENNRATKKLLENKEQELTKLKGKKRR